MTARVRSRKLQDERSDQLLSVLTILLLVMLFVVAPIQAAGFFIAQIELFGTIVGLVMVGSVLIISASWTITAVMLAGLLLNIFVVITRFFRPAHYDLYLMAGAWFIIVSTLGLVVARRVFGPGKVNFHRVVGAILLYLLIALAFVSLFTLVGIWIPNAFNGLVFEDNRKTASDVIYFSFVTLTSTGYGDIYPVNPIARSLCNVETIIGQLYPATLLARLVTLEIDAPRR